MEDVEKGGPDPQPLSLGPAAPRPPAWTGEILLPDEGPGDSPPAARPKSAERARPGRRPQALLFRELRVAPPSTDRAPRPPSEARLTASHPSCPARSPLSARCPAPRPPRPCSSGGPGGGRRCASPRKRSIAPQVGGPRRPIAVHTQRTDHELERNGMSTRGFEVRSEVASRYPRAVLGCSFGLPLLGPSRQHPLSSVFQVL